MTNDKAALFRFVQLRNLPKYSPGRKVPVDPTTHRDPHLSLEFESTRLDALRSQFAADPAGTRKALRNELRGARALAGELQAFRRITESLRQRGGASDVTRLRQAIRGSLPDKAMKPARIETLAEQASYMLGAARLLGESSARAQHFAEDALRGLRIWQHSERADDTPDTLLALVDAPVRLPERAAARPATAEPAPDAAAGLGQRISIVDRHDTNDNPLAPGGLVSQRLVPYAGGLLGTSQSSSDGQLIAGLPGVPSAVGEPRALSIGDLYVSTIESISYEYGEIAHVENVMQTESRERVKKLQTLSRTEDRSSSMRAERESTELQTVEQYELQQAMDQAASSSSTMSMSAGVSAGYGPVSVSTNFGTTSSSNRSSSIDRASNFSRSVTSKAVQEVASKVRSARRTVTEVRSGEKNAHGFDNRYGSNHVVGIYRYLDKRVTTRLSNYGKRLMLEFIVPEPAAVLVQALINAAPSTMTLQPPEPFELMPDEISESNYREIAARYGVSDVPLPTLLRVQLEHHVTVEPADIYDYPGVNQSQKDLDNDPDQAAPIRQYFSGSERIEVPDNYLVSDVTATGAFATLRDPRFDDVEVDFVDLDSEWFEFAADERTAKIINSATPGGHTASISCSNVNGPVSIAWAGASRHGFGVTLTILCEQNWTTEEPRWQQTVWGLINDAYQARKSAYDSQLAYALSGSRSALSGNPRANRDTERTELKRGVLSLLTEQQFRHFGSLSFPSGRMPLIDLAEARLEGEYLRFFEEAIEWPNLVSVLYDYTWAGRHRWQELLSRSATDPEHQAFLRAGAAKVIVPVTPGHEVALLNYLDTGDLWDGESEITLDPAHALHEEITELIREPRDLDAVDAGTEETLVPTNLVILQLGPDPNQIDPVPPIITPPMPPTEADPV